MWDYRPIHHFLWLAAISKQGREMGKFWWWGSLYACGRAQILSQILRLWVSSSFEWRSWENFGACAVWDWVSCCCDCLYKKWIARTGAAGKLKTLAIFTGEGGAARMEKMRIGFDINSWLSSPSLSLLSRINSETAKWSKLQKATIFCKHNVLTKLHCSIKGKTHRLGVA